MKKESNVRFCYERHKEALGYLKEGKTEEACGVYCNKCKPHKNGHCYLTDYDPKH